MTPEEYEHYVAQSFKEMGYETVVTSFSNDYGVDVFAIKGDEKIAIQVKKYGDSNRKINRDVFLKLHGSKDYFDCTKAIVATDGSIMPDAKQVAEKLGIEIMYISEKEALFQEKNDKVQVQKHISKKDDYPDFSIIWKEYIKPMEGQYISNSKGSNKIIEVNDLELKRCSINNKPSKVDRDLFKFAYEYIIRNGSVTRDYINQQFDKKCSSIIYYVLAQIPFIEMKNYPKQTLIIKTK